MANERPIDDRRDDDDVFIDADAAWGGDEPYMVRPRWVKPVGIISIVWGAIWVICSGLSTLQTTLGASFMKSMAQNMQGGMPDVYLNPPQILVVAGVVGTLWSLFAIVGGGVLLGRRPVARTMALIYAIVAIPLVLWGAKLGLDVQVQVRQWVADNPNADFAQMPQAGGGSIFVVVFAVIQMSWPLFLLFWFTVVKRKAVDIVGEAAVMPPAA